MAWITGDRRNGFRANWREGGRESPQKVGPTRATRAEAEVDGRAAEERIKQLRSLQGPLQSSAPIATLLERWAASRLNGFHAREHRVRLVVDTITTIAEQMGWKQAADITVDSVDRWMQSKGKRGVVKPLKMIKAFVRYCRPLKVGIDYDVVDIPLPAVPKRPPSPLLTNEQVAQCLALVERIGGHHVYVAVKHFATYACRPIDIARAQVRDWDSATRILTFRDTKNRTDQPKPVIDPDHAADLDALAKDCLPDAPLFLDPWGRPWRITKHGSAGGINDWYRANIGQHLYESGVLEANQRGIYKLKKWGMTRLKVAAGGDTRSVRAVSGHLDDESVETYQETNIGAQVALLSKLPPFPTLPAAVAIAGPGSVTHSPKTRFASTAASTESVGVQNRVVKYRRKRLPKQ